MLFGIFFTICQLSFRQWLGVVRQQAITRATVDQPRFKKIKDDKKLWWANKTMVKETGVSGQNADHDDVIKVSASLALCEGNSPVDSPHKGQWHRALFFFFFDLRLNILLSKQSRRRWYRAYFDITVIFPLQSITLFIWFNHRHMAINDIVPEIHHKWTFYCYLLSCPIALIVHFNYLWYIHNEADSFITSLNICYWSMECYFGEERS